MQIIPNVSVAVMLWIGLALLFAFIELATVGLFFVFLAGGALMAAGVACITSQVWWQVLAFGVFSVVFTLFARPLLLGVFQLKERPAKPSNVQALIGMEALVMEPVSRYQGKVKMVHNGEVWSAYLSDESLAEVVLAVDRVAIVQRVDGAKLAVIPK